MDEPVARIKSDDENLDGRINAWKLGLTAIGAALVGAYFVYFALMQGQPAATDADKWGAFGDFVGGLLNPIVAFAAFYWLTQSVKLQRRELAETREELRKTSEAQKDLVANGLVSVQLAALSSLSNTVYSEIAWLHSITNKINANRPPEETPVQRMLYDQEQATELALVERALAMARAEREVYISQMKSILAKYGGMTIRDEAKSNDAA